MNSGPIIGSLLIKIREVRLGASRIGIIRPAFLSLFLLFCSFRAAPSTEADEYSVKAVFIFNFTKYIEWQSAASENQFIIGILGNSPIGEPLNIIARTKTVNGKKILIRRFNSPQEISHCHILFISQTTSYQLKDVLAKISAKGTLVVSEKEGYAKNGAAVNFTIINDNVKFEINPSVVSSADLKVSSQLLKLAIIVQ